MLPQAPRNKGDNARPEHFTYVQTPYGSTWDAYIAGSTQWLFVHPKKAGTKPCLHEMTGGELGCSICSAAHIPVVKGFVPLYRQIDSKPVFVICDEALRDTLDGFRLHTRVAVGREKSLGSGVWLTRKLEEKPLFQSTLPARNRPVDLTVTLLRVFKMAALVDWYKHTHGLGEVVPQCTLQESKPVPVSEVVAEDDHLIGDNVLNRWIGKLPPEKQEEIRKRRRAADQSANGNGKPK